MVRVVVGSSKVVRRPTFLRLTTDYKYDDGSTAREGEEERREEEGDNNDWTGVERPTGVFGYPGDGGGVIMKVAETGA